MFVQQPFQAMQICCLVRNRSTNVPGPGVATWVKDNPFENATYKNVGGDFATHDALRHHLSIQMLLFESDYCRWSGQGVMTQTRHCFLNLRPMALCFTDFRHQLTVLSITEPTFGVHPLHCKRFLQLRCPNRCFHRFFGTFQLVTIQRTFGRIEHLFVEKYGCSLICIEAAPTLHTPRL